MCPLACYFLWLNLLMYDSHCGALPAIVRADWLAGWMDVWMDGWLGRWMQGGWDEWADEWMDR